MSNSNVTRGKETTTTIEGRLIWGWVFKARENKNEDGSVKLKFEATLILPKGTDIAPYIALLEKVGVERWSNNKNLWPKGWKDQLGIKRAEDKTKKNAEGEDIYPEGLEPGAFVMKATSEDQPVVVDHNLSDIINQKDVYNGCYGCISVNAYAYGGPGTNFKPGIGFGLRGFQKTQDGVPIGRRIDAKKEFKKFAAPGGASAGAATGGTKSAGDLM